MWCVDNVVLLGALCDDLKLALEKFLDECEEAEMRILTSKSKTMVPSQKMVR